MTKHPSVVLLTLLLLTAPVAACWWDCDTIDTELRGVPGAALLASGRWYRHGPAYYGARVSRLEGRELSLAEYDDLAVAYGHLGSNELGLRVMDKKAVLLASNPNPLHQYRYHANRGTLLAHSGRYEEALREIDLALELNPEAHFGRERYQRDLIRYIAAASADPKLWTEHNFLSWSGDSVMPGRTPLARLSFTGPPEVAVTTSTFEDALKGVAGMLRFGGLEGPELYRCLGDLCLTKQDLNLAWFFYLKAIERGHPGAKAVERSVISIEAHWREAGFVGPTREDFRLTQESAKLWLEAFQRAEREALKRGADTSQTKAVESFLERADLEVPYPPWGAVTPLSGDRWRRGKFPDFLDSDRR